MKEVCRIVEQALELPEGNVTLADNMQTIENWDSLGLLSILVGLEQQYGSKVTSIESLSKVKSVQEIIDILKEESVI
jgi:acyl carrier protein